VPPEDATEIIQEVASGGSTFKTGIDGGGVYRHPRRLWKRPLLSMDAAHRRAPTVTCLRLMLSLDIWAFRWRYCSMKRRFAASVILFLLTPLLAFAQDTEAVNVLDANSAAIATLFVPRRGIQPSEIAVLINDNDPQSVDVANYYQQKRNIPSQNMIHLNFHENKLYPGFAANNGIDRADFAVIKAQVDATVGPEIQAYVITWSRPFRIANFNYYSTNYSITSAFTFGIDPNYMDINSCGAMPPNRYYNSNSSKPYTDFHIRPAMMLAGVSTANVKATIDKGSLADRSFPTGDGWFVRTPDAARSNPRYLDFKSTVQDWNRPKALSMSYVDYSTGASGDIANRPNILFYQTGAANVPRLQTNNYAPGALADHLTSAGGDLFGTTAVDYGQMSILRWLEAGATASYGTETEPCAWPQKFPQASVLVKNYFLGNTAVEAYLKSVQWPSQGVFVGDPLARPFGTKATLVNDALNITTTSLEPGVPYALYSAPSNAGPFTQVATISVPNYQIVTISSAGMRAPFYKLEDINASKRGLVR
jgi:uncharacterized protein (TIGR03790 family)